MNCKRLVLSGVDQCRITFAARNFKCVGIHVIIFAIGLKSTLIDSLDAMNKRFGGLGFVSAENEM